MALLSILPFICSHGKQQAELLFLVPCSSLDDHRSTTVNEKAVDELRENDPALSNDTAVSMLSFHKIIMFFLWTSRRQAIGFSVRRVSTAHKETLYSLNDHVCPPTDEEILRKTVEKHCQTLDRYLAQKPIAGHTQDAFDTVRALVANTTTATEGIILDRFVQTHAFYSMHFRCAR